MIEFFPEIPDFEGNGVGICDIGAHDKALIFVLLQYDVYFIFIGGAVESFIEALKPCVFGIDFTALGIGGDIGNIRDDWCVLDKADTNCASFVAQRKFAILIGIGFLEFLLMVLAYYSIQEANLRP